MMQYLGDENQAIRDLGDSFCTDIDIATRVLSSDTIQAGALRTELQEGFVAAARSYWRDCEEAGAALGHPPSRVLRNALVATCKAADVRESLEAQCVILRTLSEAVQSSEIASFVAAIEPNATAVTLMDLVSGATVASFKFVHGIVRVLDPQSAFRVILALVPPKRIADTVVLLRSLKNLERDEVTPLLSVLAGNRRIPKKAKQLSASAFGELSDAMQLAILLDNRLMRSFGAERYGDAHSAQVDQHRESVQAAVVLAEAQLAVRAGDCLGKAVQRLHGISWTVIKRHNLSADVVALIGNEIRITKPPTDLPRRRWRITCNWAQSGATWLHEFMSSSVSERSQVAAGIPESWQWEFLQTCGRDVRSASLAAMLSRPRDDTVRLLRAFGENVSTATLAQLLSVCPRDELVQWVRKASPQRWASVDRIAKGALKPRWAAAVLDPAIADAAVSKVRQRDFATLHAIAPMGLRNWVRAVLSARCSEPISGMLFGRLCSVCREGVIDAISEADEHVAKTVLPLVAALQKADCRRLLSSNRVHRAMGDVLCQLESNNAAASKIEVLVSRSSERVRRRLVRRKPELFPSLASAYLRPDELLRLGFRKSGSLALAEQSIAGLSLRHRAELARSTAEGIEATARELAACTDLSAVASFRKLLMHWMDRMKAGAPQGTRFDDCYTTHERPKRSGGTRTITAPNDVLKWAQRAILEGLLNQQSLHEAVHGFRLGHSIVTNASCHVGQRMVVNVDIKGFFPNTRLPLIRRVLSGCLGGAVSKLAFACMIDICSYKGGLPTGAPTSPAIGNIVLRPADTAIAKAAAKYGVSYTRYADDLTFSGGTDTVKILPFVERVLSEYGYELDPKKQGIFRRGRQQPVTGLIVNDKVNVTRRSRRRMRAAVHARTVGRTPTWHGKPVSDAQLRGRLAFLKMVQPDESQRLLAMLENAIEEQEL